MPQPRLLARIDNWPDFRGFVTNRIHPALRCVDHHPTDAKYTRLRLSGSIGMWAILRLLELLRRCTRSQEIASRLGSDFMGFSSEVNALIVRTEVVLSQEMWRRWADGSFERSPHSMGGNLHVLWKILMEGRVANYPCKTEVSQLTLRESGRELMWVSCSGFNADGTLLKMCHFWSGCILKPAFATVPMMS